MRKKWKLIKNDKLKKKNTNIWKIHSQNEHRVQNQADWDSVASISKIQQLDKKILAKPLTVKPKPLQQVRNELTEVQHPQTPEEKWNQLRNQLIIQSHRCTECAEKEQWAARTCISSVASAQADVLARKLSKIGKISRIFDLARRIFLRFYLFYLIF